MNTTTKTTKTATAPKTAYVLPSWDEVANRLKQRAKKR